MMSKAGTCEACLHWRDKGWDSDRGIGVCDNPRVEVRGLSEEHLTHFYKLAPEEARSIAQSTRFPSDFGCRHHEPLKPLTPTQKVLAALGAPERGASGDNIAIGIWVAKILRKLQQQKRL